MTVLVVKGLPLLRRGRPGFLSLPQQEGLRGPTSAGCAVKRFCKGSNSLTQKKNLNLDLPLSNGVKIMCFSYKVEGRAFVRNHLLCQVLQIDQQGAGFYTESIITPLSS